MMSSTGKKLITVNILPNISRRKGNQTVKFGQSIEYTVKNIFLQKSCRKEARRLVSGLFCFSENLLHEVKARGQYPKLHFIVIKLDIK